ncbi:RNA 2',3'-cyclic phosphodiesterase [Pedococcus sp. NPDC057267]|uniref:RNA 2',3'-cyclic phosphodiesterase n=1 Tax=Pedococcus sp. NPDC057267 TaxID=3346077 RepID=UPI0036406D5C
MFAALVPPAEAVEDLDAFLEPRRDAGDHLRWTDPDQWHVTLAFMADVPERSLDPLVEELHDAVRGRAALSLRVRGAGAFPEVYDARVLWAGVDGATDALVALARGVRRAAARAGASPQGGPFHPHVTLARSRRPFESTRWVRVLDAYAGPAWTASEVTLFASHLGEGRGHRPRHEPVAVVPLGSAEA